MVIVVVVVSGQCSQYGCYDVDCVVDGVNLLCWFVEIDQCDLRWVDYFEDCVNFLVIDVGYGDCEV